MIRYAYILFACFFVQLSVCMEHQQSEFKESVPNKVAQPVVNQEADCDGSDFVPLWEANRQPSILNIRRMAIMKRQGYVQEGPASFKSGTSCGKNVPIIWKVGKNVRASGNKIPFIKLGASVCHQRIVPNEKVAPSILTEKICFDKQRSKSHVKKVEVDSSGSELPRLNVPGHPMSSASCDQPIAFDEEMESLPFSEKTNIVESNEIKIATDCVKTEASPSKMADSPMIPVFGLQQAIMGQGARFAEKTHLDTKRYENDEEIDDYLSPRLPLSKFPSLS